MSQRRSLGELSEEARSFLREVGEELLAPAVSEFERRLKELRMEVKRGTHQMQSALSDALEEGLSELRYEVSRLEGLSEAVSTLRNDTEGGLGDVRERLLVLEELLVSERRLRARVDELARILNRVYWLVLVGCVLAGAGLVCLVVLLSR